MNRSRIVECSTLVLASVLAVPTARAQCPDGSPPPCRAAQTVAAAPRRVNPPLDERTWIVVPFDNLAKSADVEWLRGASVNLLYLDMSRWRDIRVIDDERVADLMREVPEAKDAQALSLNAGLAVARRAGAGKLVMGDVLKLGSRTAVTAKVFDVRSGQRTKSVREETSVQDSVMSLFGKLAQKVLNVAPPQGANIGALGTSSVGAYQEYIAGVAALNKFDLTEARRRLEQALKLDSTFALAHYKLSIVMGWEDAASPLRKPHAEAAARLAAGLPPRERALIAGQLQQSNNEWTRACETYGALARADSTDVEAWYGVGECLFHDPTIEAVNGDTTRMRFRANLDQSIRAFEHVLQLDPTYHLAYQHIIDALTAERHATACYYSDPSARCAPYSGLLIRSGDSLVATAVPAGDVARLRAQAERYFETRSRRRNLQIANATANAWVAASPDELRALTALAHVLLLQGRLADASAALKAARSSTITDQLRMLLERMEIAYKQGRATEAIRLYDSVRTANIPIPNGNPPQFGNAIAGYGPAFGRMTEFDSLVQAQVRNAPPMVGPYQRHAIRAAFAGIVSDSLASTERAIFDQTNQARGANAATRAIISSLSYALRAPRPSWPALDTSIVEPRMRPAFALSVGDTAKLRVAARALDTIVSRSVAAQVADSGFAIIAADAYLVLRDSLSALRVLRLALDSALNTTSLFPLQGSQGNAIYLLARMMWTRADLAAALGQKDEARIWYTRFIDIWSTASPELQPVVERARRSRAALTP